METAFPGSPPQIEESTGGMRNTDDSQEIRTGRTGWVIR